MCMCGIQNVRKAGNKLKNKFLGQQTFLCTFETNNMEKEADASECVRNWEGSYL